MDNYDFTIPEGTVFHLPEIRSSLPEECHPRCRELEEHAYAFARPHLIAYFGDEERADRFIGQGMAHFGCVGYPRGHGARLQAVCNSILPAALLDDAFSQPGLQGNLPAVREFHAGWSAVFAGERPPAGANPVFIFVHETIEECISYASPGLVARIRDGWQDAADAFLEEAIRRQRNEVLDFDSFIERRVRVNFGKWTSAHVELALGIDLGELADNSLIQASGHHAVLHMGLSNDCYSLVKEIIANESTNSIIELIRHDGMDLQAAVNKVVERIYKAERDYLLVRDDIRRSDLGGNADVTAFLDGLNFSITGNLGYLQSNTRYHGLDHDGSRVISGPITIRHIPTVHSSM